MKKRKERQNHKYILFLFFLFLHDTSGHDNHEVLSQVLETVFSDKTLIQYENPFGIFSVHPVTCPLCHLPSHHPLLTSGDSLQESQPSAFLFSLFQDLYLSYI